MIGGIATGRPSRAVHVLVFDGFADWEPAYALAEIRRSGKRKVTVIGFDENPVTSMGGLRVSPERSIADVQAADVELLVLPGGDLWEGAYPRAELEALLAALIAAAAPIAAICGATLAVARAGLLNDRRHTSNMPGYLREHVPEYRGDAAYDPALAVSDRGVITASGLGPVEFARAVFRELGIFGDADERLWFDMFKHGRIPVQRTL
jgi:putative intracellular protease/amidase